MSTLGLYYVMTQMKIRVSLVACMYVPYVQYVWHLPMTSVDAKIFRQNPTLPVAFF